MESINLQKGINPQDEPDLLGLIIRITDIEVGNAHTGFIALKQNHALSIAHLVARQYRFEDYQDKYFYTWFKDLDESISVPLMARLKRLSMKTSIQVEYSPAFSGNGKLDDETGKYIPDPNLEIDGLTCATFVILILEDFGIELIDRSSWEVTPQDTLWFERMIQDSYFLFTEHFAQKLIENKNKYPRFRPEQLVGAACLYDCDPINFDTASEAGLQVLEKIKSYN